MAGDLVDWLRGWFWANAQTIAAIVTIIGALLAVAYEIMQFLRRAAGIRTRPVDPAKEPKGLPAIGPAGGNAVQSRPRELPASRDSEDPIIPGSGNNLIDLRSRNGVERTAKFVSLSDAKPGTYGFGRREDVMKAEGHPFPLEYLWPDATTSHDTEVHKAVNGKVYLVGYCDPKELARATKRNAKGLRYFGLFRHRFKAAGRPVAIDIEFVYATNWYQFAGKGQENYPQFLAVWLLD